MIATVIFFFFPGSLVILIVLDLLPLLDEKFIRWSENCGRNQRDFVGEKIAAREARRKAAANRKGWF